MNWRGIISLRNILVHDDLGVRLIRIWDIVEHDLPELKRKVGVLLQALGAAPFDSEGEKGEDYMMQSRKPKLLDLVAVLRQSPDTDVEVGDIVTVVELLPPNFPTGTLALNTMD